ncbi:helix-turn-helix domain-containing protein [Epibacterium ulvae]|uniref:DUF6456 domain-containing protein n=1 Tax=Epibacterium ulvae TaxID=1156985 RepID=UPI001BFC6366|nr:DUF6456 domain-containing protein [Epibacterium ulvae]MBT8154374.1 helix-turn-helix domain-containing protein [Epibacterium ulvae]
MQTLHVTRVPRWVPEDARRYLEHTEKGRSIRQIARLAGCHPSTVMRQVRRIEILRDDPLIDSALQDISNRYFAQEGAFAISIAPPEKGADNTPVHGLLQVMGWLNRSQTVLAYAQGMERAVIVRGDQEKISIGKEVAGEVALRGWLSNVSAGRISRYQLNDQGRAALSQMMADQENRARLHHEAGFAEAAAGFQSPPPGGRNQVRRACTDTPLSMLARLSDRNGDPFLTHDLVRCGERLREDFELAQIGDHVQAAQQAFADGCSAAPLGMQAPTDDARTRAMEALAALGPGLSDIAIRCCCYLEGLETAEKQLGWSARSGKVVLRIALQQLKSHYDQVEAQKMMIG